MNDGSRQAGFTITMPNNLPDDYYSDVEDLVQELEALVLSYVSNLEYLLEAGRSDLTVAKIILAQNMKSKIMIHQSHEMLRVADSVIAGLVTAADVGFPEFERGGLDD